MSRDDAGLALGVNVQGYGQRPAAWRTQDVAPDALLTRSFWEDLGRTAERGLIDAIFFADAPALGDPNARPVGIVEPFAAAQVALAATSQLGAVVTASTTYNDPVELAERTLGLDLLSGGRSAWNAVTTYAPDASGNFGLGANPPRADRYRRAQEFVEVVHALWDSASTGVDVEHRGEYFELVGRLTTPPSAQGRPAQFQAGGSPEGRELASRFADGVFAVELTVGPARENRRNVKRDAARFGRRPDDVTIMPGLSLVLGSTEEEARRRYDDLEALAPDGYALASLASYFDDDIRALPLDEPIPRSILDAPWDPAVFGRSVGYRQTVLAWVRENNTSIRDLVREFGGYGARIIVGTPEQAADSIEEWYRTGAADGFNLMVDELPRGLETVVDQLIPLLQERGLFHREYEHPTLRGRLAARSRPVG